MSKGNPQKAMAALLPCPIGDVRPMTLAMYAALERIKSPLVTGVNAADSMELLPSLYLLTHGPEEIFKANLLELAIKWADTVPVTAMDEIRAACAAQVQLVQDVIPERDPKKAKTSAGTTAGSPRSSTTSRAPIIGASERLSGTSRSRRSRSSGGKKH